MSAKSAISLLLGGAVSLLALYWAFRRVPLQALGDYLMAMDYAWLVPAVLIVMLSFILRVLRWQLLLSASWKVTFRQAFHPLMIGFMINFVLPGRLGELARPAILNRKTGVPFATGLATVVAERIFDTLTLLALLAVVLLWTPLQEGARIEFGGYQLTADLLRLTARSAAGLSVLLLAGTVLISHDRLRGGLQGLIQGIPDLFRRWGQGRWASRGRRWFSAPLNRCIDKAADGLATVKSPAKVLACSALSFCCWLLIGFSYYLVALGAPGIELSYFDLLAVMIIICFFIALPSVPGYWGLWEAGGVFALGLFGVDPRWAAGYTLANHGIQILPVMIVGLGSALITGVSLKPATGGESLANH